MNIDPKLLVMAASSFKVDSIKHYLADPVAPASEKVAKATVVLSTDPADSTNGSLAYYEVPAAVANQFVLGGTYNLYLVKA